MNATLDAAAAAHVDDETIDRLRAAQREYGEQCAAAAIIGVALLLTALWRNSTRSK